MPPSQKFWWHSKVTDVTVSTKCHTKRFPRYIRNKTNEAGLPRSQSLLHWISDGAYSNQTIYYSERAWWFNDIPQNRRFGCNKETVSSYIRNLCFYKYLENASRNSLSLHLRCLLMVHEQARRHGGGGGGGGRGAIAPLWFSCFFFGGGGACQLRQRSVMMRIPLPHYNTEKSGKKCVGV